MKITEVISHILQYDLEEELGYSQQFYSKRTVHLVEIRTDEGVSGWGECFGGGNVALANRGIIQNVISPMIMGEDPANREYLWHKIYNLLRDHGQKGMPVQALSGIDIALWDIAGKVAGLPLYKLIGGKCRDTIKVYGYGMMLRRTEPERMAAIFAEEAQDIYASGYTAIKMKIGLGAAADVRLAEAVRRAVPDHVSLMADANHCYTTSDALFVGRALSDLKFQWFEEPVAPEDLDGYVELRSKLDIPIAGGEVEFSRWGWREILCRRCVDFAQPEVCAMGGISEYLKVLAMAHAHFIPVNNHVWGSALSIATNIHLLAAMPPLPGGLHPWEPMLEFDTTPNLFKAELVQEGLCIERQVKQNGGRIDLIERPGIGVVPDFAFIERFQVV